MTDDLLTRIQREMDERLRELRGAVDEHERLAVDLRALDAQPEPPVVPEPPVAPQARVAPEPSADPQVRVAPGPLAATEAPAAPEPPANVVRLPVRRELPCTPMVSPKVARLMLAPRRPALERAGVVRVGAAGPGSFADATVDEVDVEAEVYERAV